MPTGRKVLPVRDDFLRAQTFTTTPAGEFGWTSKVTGTTPTTLCISADQGTAKLLCTSTSEAQIASLYQNDVLPFRLSQLLAVEFNVSVVGIDSVSTLTFGIASARNDTADSVAFNAQFRMEGSASTSLIVVETDDAVTDNDDKATGVSLSTTFKRCLIDFSYGLTDVRFFIDGARVTTGTTFSMNATPTQQVQLNCQIQKASGTGVPGVLLDYVEVVHRTAA